MGCGRRAPKGELLRVVLRGEGTHREAVADPSARLPGRGAYLCAGARPNCANADCVAQASRRGALSRALRAKVTVPAELVESV